MASTASGYLRFATVQILCFCSISLSVFAQNTKSLHTRQTSANAPYYSRHEAYIDAARQYTIKPDFSFTALAISIEQKFDFKGAYVIVSQDTLFLQEDEHQPEDDNLRQSVLLIIDKAQHSFIFYPADIRGNVSFSLLNAEEGRKKANTRTQKQKKQLDTNQDGTCHLPSLIRTSIWREGLPEPSYNRVETDVGHVIVHHSAGSNTSTDYVNTVRNIYLFHTQVRGWSDIGYNYLIAQDGTIFQGRSFSNDEVENDDIRGAHFCGQNSGTMGICMLGNYNTVLPTDTSVSALVRLTGWKLHKESLDPLAGSSHPANNNLSVIAGHRNGCATECPGDNLYAMLNDIRLEVEAYLKAGCEEEAEALAFNVYPVPAEEKVNFTLPSEQVPEEIWMIDAGGKKFSVSAYLDQEGESWVVDTRLLAAGIYVLQINGSNFEQKRKLLIY
ncbi:hypothetical protein OKW21_005322 [Catalinimonas alkaloidigena]|uniref:N-acetylmuramoyl-L-alanine amidase n=1 Tax=Catalinimonas alkaloidigena TaxID=1075417 RepID=UPI002406EEE6|nr:N-acetylmuramoyl-L-alanine amidase [Catalinimonas alkaloidigena]MDF9800059.1 hypothetical protein [Catalinimonas alkaloidigena]